MFVPLCFFGGSCAQVDTLVFRSRALYEERLTTYLTPLQSSLSRESVLRLEKGTPLRVLDSKSPEVCSFASLRAYAVPCFDLKTSHPGGYRTLQPSLVPLQ